MFKEAGGGQLGLKVLTPVPFPTRKQKLVGSVMWQRERGSNR